MSITVAYWVLMLIWLVFGLATNWPGGGFFGRYGGVVNSLLLFVLFRPARMACFRRADSRVGSEPGREPWAVKASRANTMAVPLIKAGGTIGLICNKQNAPRDDSRRGVCFFAAAETDQLPLMAPSRRRKNGYSIPIRNSVGVDRIGAVQAKLVSVINMSAYQAQFSPSASSRSTSRTLTSSRDECTPSSRQGRPPSWPASSPRSRITTGAPLAPRCVRASVRK